MARPSINLERKNSKIKITFNNVEYQRKHVQTCSSVDIYLPTSSLLGPLFIALTDRVLHCSLEYGKILSNALGDPSAIGLNLNTTPLVDLRTYSSAVTEDPNNFNAVSFGLMVRFLNEVTSKSEDKMNHSEPVTFTNVDFRTIPQILKSLQSYSTKDATEKLHVQRLMNELTNIAFQFVYSTPKNKKRYSPIYDDNIFGEEE